jgi:hypothetical protein
MTKPDIQSKTFAGNAGKAKGREFIRRNGEQHYINHAPHFSVHYYPTEQPERVWYKTWEDDAHVFGRNLRGVYEDLKANAPNALRESDGPQDAERPYIETIEVRLRL